MLELENEKQINCMWERTEAGERERKRVKLKISALLLLHTYIQKKLLGIRFIYGRSSKLCLAPPKHDRIIFLIEFIVRRRTILYLLMYYIFSYFPRWIEIKYRKKHIHKRLRYDDGNWMERYYIFSLTRQLVLTRGGMCVSL